jgi:hypothetical protein
MLTPDRDSRLSDGVVIETRLRARLLGAPVLRIDGTVLVSPARVDSPTPPRAVQGDLVSGSRDLVRTVPGAALAQASRLLEESRACLGRCTGH